jgi:hypothetical protein
LWQIRWFWLKMGMGRCGYDANVILDPNMLGVPKHPFF